MFSVTEGRVDCRPEEVGYDASRLEAVNSFFSRMVEQKVIHGVSYRVARRGKVFAAAALGGRHYRDADVPMQPDSVYGIASVTKAFAAAAIQILVEDGRVSIEDKVAKYLSQFDGAPYNGITLFHLLTHTSGLYSEGSIPDKHHQNCFWHIEQQYKLDGSDTDWIAAGLRSGMRRPPGAEWQYCSFGIAVLGAIIETVTGVKSEDFIIEQICKPLGMTSTAFKPTPDMARRAVIFDEDTEGWVNQTLRGEPADGGMWELLPQVAWGMISTVNDQMRFAQMLQQGGRLDSTRVLGRKAIESMTTQYLKNTPDFCWGANTAERLYGLGVDMRRFTGSLTSPGTFFHEGSGHSVIIVDPKEEMACVCVYPWVDGQWNGDCNNRLFNVIWSGLM